MLILSTREDIDLNEWYTVDDITTILGMQRYKARNALVQYKDKLNEGLILPKVFKKGNVWQITGEGLIELLDILGKALPTKKKGEKRVTTMAKKDFSNVKTSSVYDTISEATARPEEDTIFLERPLLENPQEEQPAQVVQDVPIITEAQEAQVLNVKHVVNAILDRQEEKRKEKTKAKRINMAFTDENYQYINVMSRIKGLTLTDFINEIIAQSREKNSDLYLKAADLLKEFNL